MRITFVNNDEVKPLTDRELEKVLNENEIVKRAKHILSCGEVQMGPYGRGGAPGQFDSTRKIAGSTSQIQSLRHRSWEYIQHS